MTPPISRAEWGAQEQDGFGDRPVPVTELWLHHSMTIAPDLIPPFTDDDAAVRTLERIGESRFGGGISYTRVCTPVGRLYVGHSWHRRGAHTKGHNTVASAYVLVGNHTKNPPTAAQEEAIARDMVEQHRAGKSTRHTLNGAHRDASGNSTDCCGDAAAARIPSINRRAEALWDAGYPGVSPGPAPVPTPESTAGGLNVDGVLGPRTITRLQTELKSKGYRVVVDGELSRPSMCVDALQQYLNGKAGVTDREGRKLVTDGLGLQSNSAGRYPTAGTTNTIEALQDYLRTSVDGYLSSKASGGSSVVRELQRRLNADTF